MPMLASIRIGTRGPVLCPWLGESFLVGGDALQVMKNDKMLGERVHKVFSLEN